VSLAFLALALWRLARRTHRCGGRRHQSCRQQYREVYLRSAHWRTFRHDWWVAHPLARCTDCGAGHPLDLHHLTYERRGHERQGDVIPLCRHCHDVRHGQGARVAA
jgi:hypothetical protein